MVGGLDLAFAQINWESHVSQTIRRSATLLKMVAMSSILADDRMLPGDFLLDKFADDPLVQLCCTGMKISSAFGQQPPPRLPWVAEVTWKLF